MMATFKGPSPLVTGLRSGKLARFALGAGGMAVAVLVPDEPLPILKNVKAQPDQGSRRW